MAINKDKPIQSGVDENKNNATKTRRKSKGNDAELLQALELVKKRWGDESAWDNVEALADSLNDPTAVAKLYRDALEISHSDDVSDMLARRAVMFFEEWFGDDQEQVNSVLSTIIEKNNSATWAFERLTEFLTVHERWDELFDTYDSLLAQQISDKRRKMILEEASNIARDIADNPERSLGYLIALQELDRDNFNRFTGIVRMLKKSERWEDMIALQRGQMPLMKAKDSAKTWIQIANLYFEKLNSPTQAFDELKSYLQAYPDDAVACEQMARLLSDESLALSTKLEIIKLLNDVYVVIDREKDIVNAIETVIPFCDAKSAVSLHRMASSHLALLDQDEPAINHLASLLLLEPGDAEALKNIRLLSVRAKKPVLRAEALVKAAEACSEDALKIAHLNDAARIYADDLKENKTAIDILGTVANIPDLEDNVALTVAHKLNELYAAEGLKEERLRVLSQLADLEKTDVLKRTVGVEAARLASDLDNTDKALSLWQSLLERKPDDEEALSAVIDLHDRREEFSALAETLVRRAEMSKLPEQRRMDLVRAAELYREQLSDTKQAATLWRKVFEAFGPREDAVAALDVLLTEANQFEELDALLGRSVEGKLAGMRDVLLRRAEINALNLNNLEMAFQIYEKVLSHEPDTVKAIEGMEALVQNEKLSAQAVDALVAAHRTTDDWERLIALTPNRLETAKDVTAKIAVYEDAVEMQKSRAENPLEAMALLTQVLPLDPENQKVEAEMMRLAKAHGDWTGIDTALSDAAKAIDDNPRRRAHLKKLEGGVLESNLDRESEALDAYLEATELIPRDSDALESVFNVATRLGRWPEATLAFIKLTGLEDSVETDRLDILHDMAMEKGELPMMLSDLVQLLTQKNKLRAVVRRQLETGVAKYYRSDCEDLNAAEEAAKRAVAADSNHVGTLALLASIQKDNESVGFIDTLERIYTLKEDNLDFLLKASKASIKLLDDEGEMRRHLMKLYDESTAMWRRGKRATGENDIESCCHFATWEIAKLDEARGLWEQAAELLSVSASCRFEPEKSREMRLRAAALYAENGMNGAAIRVYMTAWQEKDDDVEVLRFLEKLLEAENRYMELIPIKTKLLELVQDDQQQLLLRLDIAKLAGVLEGSDVRIEMLRINLAQEPGHEESITELVRIMRQRQMFKDLSQMLTEQSDRLAEKSENARAAVMMLQAAKVFEDSLDDVDQAIVAYERVLDLDSLPAAMDALARLNASQQKLKHSITWLKRRLTVATHQDRISVLLRLARAQLKDGQNADAVSTLEQAFDEAPKHPEIRGLLLKEYRTIEDYQAMASVLSRASAHLSNPSAALSYSEEAADLYFHKLHTPDQAVDVLTRACELAPDETKFQSMLPEALVAAGKHKKAEKLLKARLKAFGRRRSRERGAVHLQLAKLAIAKEDVKDAVAQLELATAMDTHNVSALKTLAELNRDSNKLEQAEKNYRSLLLLVRRESPKDLTASVITPGEILLELSLLASNRDQDDKAKEMEEKVFESLAGSPEEIDRITARLEGLGLNELLTRVYERFLEFVETPSVRARIRISLAELFSGPLNQPEDAFEMRLKAVAEDPRSPLLHDAAEEMAKAIDQYDKYITLVTELIDASRREGDEFSRCELLIRLANIHIVNGEVDDAWKLFEQASALSVREVDVLKLGIELAKTREDEEAEFEMLSRLSKLGESSDGADARADALYRLAEISLADPDTFDEGIAMIKQGFEESPNCARAGRILLKALELVGPKTELVRLLEKVARQSDDQSFRLVHYQLKAEMPDARASEIMEGAELALSMNDGERAEAIMRRMLSVQEVDEEDKKAVAWAILTLAQQRQDAGDIEGAFKWLKDASESATSPEMNDVGLAIAEQAAAESKTELLAIDVYRWLLVLEPTNQKAWEPLAKLYYSQRDIDGFEGLTQEILYAIEDPVSRNMLRLMWSKLLLTTEDRKADALEVLKNIQLDEPTHEESIRLIARLYVDTNRRDELIEYLEYRFDSAKKSSSPEEVRVIALTLGPLKKEDDSASAQNIYRDTLALLPGDRELLEHLAAELEGGKHTEELIKIKEQLLSELPDEQVAKAAEEILNLCRKCSDEVSADRILKHAYQRVPESLVIQKILEENLRKRGDHQGLIDLLQKQVSLMTEPEDKAKAFIEIARIAKEEFNDASREIEALKEAVSLSDADPHHWLKLMESLNDANRFDEVIDVATKALEKFKQKRVRAAILNVRGQLLRKTGKKDEGFRDLKQSFALMPRTAADSYGQALNGLLKSAKNDGDAKAEREYLIEYISVLALTKKPEKRRKLLRDWLERQPEDVSLWQTLLKIENDDKRWASVVEIAEKLVYMTTDDEQMQIVLRLAEACDLVDKNDVAKRCLQHVSDLYPENAAIRDAYLNSMEKAGEYSTVASMLLEDALREENKDEKAERLRRAGVCLSHAGEGEAALHTLHRALSILPDDVNTSLSLVDIYMDRGELDTANEFADKALANLEGQKGEKLGVAQYKKALIMGSYGDTSQEIFWLEQAFLSKKEDGFIAIQLANLAEELDEWEMAQKALDRFVRLKGKYPLSKHDALLRQAKISFIHEDDPKKAINYAKKALKFNPNFEAAKEFIEAASNA